MIPWILLGALWLQPVLDEPADLRLASTGTGDTPVGWRLDAGPVAETRDGETATVPLPAGTHRLWVETDHDGTWTVLARPEVAGQGSARYTGGWSATFDPSDDAPQYGTQTDGSTPRAADRWVPALLAGAGLLLWAWPGRGRPARGEA